MIGIDTNVLLRLIVGDDTFQARVAERVVRDVCTVDRRGFVSLVVIAECVWALQNSYELSRETITHALQFVLSLKTLEVQSFEQVYFAMKSYERGELDFHDALIGSLSEANSCQATLTFDRKAARSPSFIRLPARANRG